MALFLCSVLMIFATYSDNVSSAPSKAAGGFVDMAWDTEVNGERINIQWNNTYLQTYKAPLFLNGTLYRNTPAIWKYAQFNASNPHWFNGLALLHSFKFHPNTDPTQFTIAYSSKFVNTSVYNQYNPNSN